MQQNTLVGCVDDEPYGTVPYYLLHARSVPRDDRSLHVPVIGIMDFFSFGQSRWIRHASLICLLAALSGWLLPPTLRAESGGNNSGRVSLDFNDVELSVFVRFISELTGKNFVLDEVVKKAGGKISVYSPTKVTPDQAYSMFVAALEVSRLAVIAKGNVHQIVAMGELPPERGAYVYKLKNANATDLAAILTNLVARSQTVVQATPGTRPLFRPLSEFEAPVQVFADKATNSIVISSTKGAYTKLLAVMRDLDTRRNQVFVEAVIMEVQVDRLKSIGSDPIQALALGKSGSLQGLAGFNSDPGALSTIAQAVTGAAGGAATGGALAALNTVNVRAFLQLLLNLTDTNVLSTPQVLAADNQKAKIVVGENRPFPTGQAQGITGGTLVTIERKDVGVTLEITPQVMENDLIRLEIKQELTAIAENVAQTIGSGNSSIPVGPTTTKRSMETTTIAKDQQTIVIGGLVRDNITINERKVPLLGDIPILGWLFKFQSQQIEKLNLLVFLTPTLVRDEADMVELNARKSAELGTLQRENRIEEPTKLKQDVIEKLDRQDGTPRPLPNIADPSAPLQPPVKPE